MSALPEHYRASLSGLPVPTPGIPQERFWRLTCRCGWRTEGVTCKDVEDAFEEHARPTRVVQIEKGARALHEHDDAEWDFDDETKEYFRGVYEEKAAAVLDAVLGPCV
jgi:hypothetical protein